MSAVIGVLALLAISISPFDSTPPARSERETTLSSMSKPGVAFVVTASPDLIQSSSSPATVTATIQSGMVADHVTVTWTLPDGVTLSSGSLVSVIDHIEARQAMTVEISVMVSPDANKPVLVNALMPHGEVAVGNGTTIAVNVTKAIVKRAVFAPSGDQRIFQ